MLSGTIPRGFNCVGFKGGFDIGCHLRRRLKKICRDCIEMMFMQAAVQLSSPSRFTGPFPSRLKNLEGLKELHLRGNNLTGERKGESNEGILCKVPNHFGTMPVNDFIPRE